MQGCMVEEGLFCGETLLSAMLKNGSHRLYSAEDDPLGERLK